LDLRGSTTDPNLWFGDWKVVIVGIAVCDDTLLTSFDGRATIEVERENSMGTVA
jgi:hypothetical protein